MATCSCCGEERADGQLARLHCRDDVAICGGCVGWLEGQVATVRSVPILPVVDMPAALAFYEAAGFDTESYDDHYAFVELDGEVLHLAVADGLEPATNPAACYLHTRAADEWHERWHAAGLPVGPLEDMPWGMREFRVLDPSGNVLRVGRNI